MYCPHFHPHILASKTVDLARNKKKKITKSYREFFTASMLLLYTPQMLNKSFIFLKNLLLYMISRP
jgi:hypothetical protein